MYLEGVESAVPVCPREAEETARRVGFQQSIYISYQDISFQLQRADQLPKWIWELFKAEDGKYLI